MTKKESKKKHHKITKLVSDKVSPIMDRRAMEKVMSGTGKLLSEHEFASVDEANDFLQDLLTQGGPLPSPTHAPLEQDRVLLDPAFQVFSDYIQESLKYMVQTSKTYGGRPEDEIMEQTVKLRRQESAAFLT